MRPLIICIHHSATRDGDSLSWDDIRRYHTSYRHNGRSISEEYARELLDSGLYVERPWLDIGYHFGIERIDGSYQALLGRMMNQSGAHCPADGINRRSLGICLVGNFDDEPVPPEQWQLALRLVRSLCEVLGIRSNQVIGHREVMPDRSCPGTMFDMNLFRRQLSS